MKKQTKPVQISEKEYLARLKEEDYIHWDTVVNDPMITGSGSSGGEGAVFAVAIIICIIVLICLN